MYTLLTIDPDSGSITVQGMENSWVGSTPEELGVDWKGEVTDGKEIVPYIRGGNIM